MYWRAEALSVGKGWQNKCADRLLHHPGLLTSCNPNVNFYRQTKILATGQPKISPTALAKSEQSGAPGVLGNAPGAPGNAPGALGNAPGVPGNAPGVLGNAPGAPGNAPGDIYSFIQLILEHGHPFSKI